MRVHLRKYLRVVQCHTHKLSYFKMNSFVTMLVSDFVFRILMGVKMKNSLIIFVSIIFHTQIALAAKKSLNSTMDSFNYPYKVSYFKFNSQNQNLKMAYMHVRPNKKTNKKIILFHGKNFPSFYFKPIIELLIERGYEVLAMDQIGFGKSSKPRAYMYSLAVLANNSHRLARQLGFTKYKVLGHSMGGMISTKYVKQFQNEVEKLILINPIGLEDYLRYVEYKDTNFFYKKELKKTKDSIKKYQMNAYYDGKWNENYEKLIEPAVAQLHSKDYNVVAWAQAATYNMIFSEQIVTDFDLIYKPVVLLNGTRDRTAPGRAWKKRRI